MSLRLKSPPIQTVALLLPVQSSDNSLMELFTYSNYLYGLVVYNNYQQLEVFALKVVP